MAKENKPTETRQPKPRQTKPYDIPAANIEVIAPKSYPTSYYPNLKVNARYVPEIKDMPKGMMVKIVMTGAVEDIAKYGFDNTFTIKLSTCQLAWLEEPSEGSERSEGL